MLHSLVHNFPATGFLGPVILVYLYKYYAYIYILQKKKSSYRDVYTTTVVLRWMANESFFSDTEVHWDCFKVVMVFVPSYKAQS